MGKGYFPRWGVPTCAEHAATPSASRYGTVTNLANALYHKTMPQNKKQHYVPRFYLKRFSSSGKAINIWLPQKKRKILAANLKNQCYKNYFYGSDPTFETTLGYVEAETSLIFNLADIHKELPPPGSPDHHVLVLYVLLQYSRTVYSAESTNEAMDKMAKHMFRDAVAKKGINIDDFYIGIENPSLYFMGIAIPCYPILLDLRYKLLVNLTDSEFVTSDNPVIFYNQLLPYDDITSQTGLSTRGLQVFLPIDPRAMLMLYDYDVYCVGKRDSPVVRLDRDADVHSINALQLCVASKCVYFRDKNFNMEALHKKAARYRAQQKVNVSVFEQSEGRESNRELLAMSRRDIAMHLKVSCIKLTKRARNWRSDFRKKNSQPMIIPRNEHLLQVVEQAREVVKRENFNFLEFVSFIEEECGQYWRDV